MTKLIKETRVYNLGANQVEIVVDGARILQSYDSKVVVIDGKGKVTLGRDWEYSRTTMKFVNQFLNGSSAANTRANIKSGKWKYDEKLV